MFSKVEKSLANATQTTRLKGPLENKITEKTRNRSTQVTGFPIPKYTQNPDIQNQDTECTDIKACLDFSVSGYRSSPDIKCPDIIAYVNMIRYPGLKSLDI